MIQLNDWYRVHAIRIFQFLIEKTLKRFKKYKLGYPALVVRRMEKRWGSCTAFGKITLNPEIIKAYVCSIEYIIVRVMPSGSP